MASRRIDPTGRDRETRWRVVYDDVRAMIDTGELSPGDRVPAESTLAAHHDVARSTVREAMLRLVAEGRITTGRPGIGRTVRGPDRIVWELAFESGVRLDDPVRARDAWASDVERQGRTPHQEVTASIVPATVDVADWLGIEVGAPVIERARLRLVDGAPHQISTSWFPEDIGRAPAPGDGPHDVPPFLRQGDVVLPGGVLAAIGYSQIRITDEIEARMPTVGEADQLKLPPGTPVLQHLRIGLGAADRPVRAMLTICAGDRQRLRYGLDA